jgi:hypothetical protein
MRSNHLLYLIITFLVSCSPVYYLGSGKYSSSANKKQMITPPSIFVEAVFNYKKKNFAWPTSFDNVCANSVCNEEYRKFIEGGIVSLRISYASDDTLVAPFEFSLAKHEEYKTSNRSSQIIRSFSGYYLWVKDSSFTFFKTASGKIDKNMRQYLKY